MILSSDSAAGAAARAQSAGYVGQSGGPRESRGAGAGSSPRGPDARPPARRPGPGSHLITPISHPHALSLPTSSPIITHPLVAQTQAEFK